MKTARVYLAAILMIVSCTVAAQVAINTDGSSPDASAMLDIKSDTSGILIPRMTQAERDAISSPATGLMVYQSDQTTGFWYYNGAKWMHLSTGTASVFTLDSNTVYPDTSLVDMANDNFVFGSPQLDADGIFNHANRLLFDKSKGAFRAGHADGLQWNASNMGDYSVALGWNSVASGYQAVSIGGSTTASGANATAMGYSAVASGYVATAIGEYATAAGINSTAIGYDVHAPGYESSAFGSSNKALTAYEMALGVYNTNYTAVDTNGWNPADRLLSIGNGTFSKRSDAMVILKNGNTGFGTSTPDTTLHVVGKFKYQDGTQADGYVLTSDTAGVASWQPTAANNGWRLNGNTGTSYGTNYIGTADGQNLMFKVNDSIAGRIEYTGNQNVSFGYQSLSSNTTGDENTANGNYALSSNTEGYNNTANGFGALYTNTTGNFNVANGNRALNLNTTGSSNVANGYNSLSSNTTGDNNTANGYSSLLSNTEGNFNVANGTSALSSNTTGSFNVANGYDALSSNTTGNYNSGNGTGALYNNTTGNNNTANGFFSLTANTIGSYNTALGNSADVANEGLSNATAIGANALAGADNSLVLGSINGVNNATANTKVGIGTTTPDTTLHVVGKFKYQDGSQANGKVLTSDNTGMASWQPATNNAWGLNGNTGTTYGTNYIGTADGQNLMFKVNDTIAGRIEYTANKNTSFGYQTLYSNATGNNNTANGYQALASNTGGNRNTANGSQALFSNITGESNTANGYRALYANTFGYNNTANGYYSLYSNTTGYENTANGYLALFANTTGYNNTASGYLALAANTTGYNNIAIGGFSLPNNNTGNVNIATGYGSLGANVSGNFNIATGFQALASNSTGDYNTALGYSADVASGALTNATAIGAYALAGADNSLVLGSINGVNGATASTKVGIGTTTPDTTLQVVGKFKYQDGTQANGRVLTSDNVGNASWQSVPNIIKATVNIDLPSFGLSVNKELETVTVPGAEVGATVSVSPSADLLGNCAIGFAWVSSTNTVRIAFINHNTVNNDNPAMDFYVTVVN